MNGRSILRSLAAFLALAMTASVLALAAPERAEAQVVDNPFAGIRWESVDFNDWILRGTDTRGWSILDGGNRVRRSSNNDHSAWLLPDQLVENFELRGDFRVSTNGDDDVIGFAFGIDPLDPGEQFEGYGVWWKRGPQDASPEGFRLIDLTPDPSNGFGQGGSAVFGNVGPGTGWRPNTTYRLLLRVLDGVVSVYQDGELVLEGPVDATPGLIGVYSVSQPRVNIENVAYRILESDIEVDAGPDQVVPEGSTVSLSASAVGIAGRSEPFADPIDEGWTPAVLGDWDREGSNANWTFSDDGRTALANSNQDFNSFLISPDDFSTVEFRGRMRVNTTTDDDYMTVAFGFNAPFAANGDSASNDYDDTVLFAWREKTTNSTSTPEGQYLWTYPTGQRADRFAIAENTGAGTGWLPFQWYDFEGYYSPTRMVIRIDGEVLFDVEGDFPPGRISVGALSQTQVEHTDWEYRIPNTLPAEVTWELVSQTGAPVQVLGLDTPNPTFQALDDGEYTFRATATSGDQVVSDDVKVTVENIAPSIGVEAAPTAGDGLVMASVSVTDPGILDTHGGTIDWGDGTTSTVPSSVQGAGWATVAGAHVYESIGSYAITVTVSDDDGGEIASSTEVLEVTEDGVPQPTITAGVALWADSSANKSIHIAGTSHSVTGPTHTNGELFIGGNGHTFEGPTGYVKKIKNAKKASFSPAPAKVPSADRPIEFAVADYAPGSDAAVLAGDRYFDMSGECGNKWQPNGLLESGLYYVPCEVHLKSGSFADGPITVVSTGRMHVNGKARDLMVPFVDNLLFLTDTNKNKGIQITSNESEYSGYVVSNRSSIQVSSRDNSFSCALLGETIRVTGNGHSFGSIGCAEGEVTVDGGLSDGVEVAAAPFLVPELSIDAAAPATVAPGASFDVTATITNEGATLIVPGLLAVANGRGQAVTIDAATLALEVFDPAADQWSVLNLATPSTVAAIGADTGTATYGLADGLVGSSVDPGGAGVWSVVASVQLTPAEIASLFDAAQEPLRTRLVLDLSQDAGVRQTTRFGLGITDALTAAGAAVTAADVSLITNLSGSQTNAVGDLASGATATETFAQQVAAVAPRGAGESETAYLSRLQQLNSTGIAGVASATGTADVGAIYSAGQTVVTAVDLPVLRLSAGAPAAVQPDTDATWNITVSNTGGAAATNPTLTVSIDGVDTNVALPAQIASGDAVSVAVTVPVAAGSDNVELLATLDWADAASNAYGPVAAASFATEIKPAALLVSKNVEITETESANTVAYGIFVRNVGDADSVTNVVLTDELDPAVSLVNDTVGASGGTIVSGDQPGDDSLVVDVGTLAPGEFVQVFFEVDFSGVPSSQSTISNQAVVTSNELPDVLSDDPDLPGLEDPTIHEVSGNGNNNGNDGTNGGVTIIGVGDLDGPVAGDFVPVTGDTITEPTTIAATITPTAPATVASWEAVIYPSGADPADGTVLGSGTGAPTELGEIDPTVLRNGPYSILVTATDSEGRIRLSESSVVVDGFLKLGRYSTTYLDSQVTVGGIPLQVLRTYDTLDRGESGDFGFGWNLDVGNFRVQANRALGLGQWTSTGCGPGLVFQDICFTSDPANIVTVTWPDGNTESFDIAPKGNTFFPIQATVAYTPRERATSTLSPVGNSTVSLSELDGNLHTGGFGGGPVYNPTQFLLTAKDGSTYLLDTEKGLVEATDRDGNTVTITDDGITSSLGPAMTFERDAEGRITTLTEPDGDTITYTYDASGDLTSVTDQKAATSTFGYNADHYLTEIDDPTGAQRKLFYDADGRLEAIEDANGNRTEISVDPDARTEIVTDPDGNLTTISSFDGRGNATSVDEVYDGASHVTTFTYDADDQVTSRTDPEGNTWAASYDADENLTQFVDAEGNTSNFTYDDFGFPLTVTDADGETTSFSYDTAGNISTITDARSGVQMFTYDGQGNQVTRTDQVGRVWEWSYTAESRLETATDPRNNVTSYVYDANGQVTQMTAADGGVTAYSYDGVGNLLTMTDPLNRVTTYVYDSRDLLTQVEDPSGATTTYSYDDVGRVLTRQDPTNRTWSYTYEFDRLATETAPDGGVTAYSYDGAGRVSQMTDPLNRTTSYTYDGAHRRTQVTSPIDNGATATSTTAYDGNGRVTAATNAEAETTVYAYDALGRLESMTDPIGRTTIYGYDATGNRTAVTNAETETTSWVYDLAGQLTSVTNAEAETTSYTYDATGNMATVTDPLNRVTTYGYDDVNRRTTTTLPSGDTGTTVFDLAGQVTTSTSPAGITATYAYDARGLVESITDELGNTQSSAYDPAGRLLTATDGRNNDTTFTYDPNGRLLSETDPLGGTVTFGYDLAGQRISLTDPNNATRTFAYDDGGRMTAATDAEQRATSYVYDAVGRRTGMTDARGITITSTFDDAGQLTGQVSPNETRSYSYDNAGRRTAWSDASGATSVEFDDAGRMTGITTPAGTVGYGYNAAGEQITMTQPEGTVTTSYDQNGYVDEVADWRGDTIVMSNDADGRMLNAERSNGVDTNYWYDTAGRLTGVDHANTAGPVDGFQYMLDGNGNRTMVASNAGSESYTIDALNRITNASYPGGLTEVFVYDDAGNRTSHTKTDGTTVGYTVDATGQLVSDTSGTTYTYDEAGNLTATSDGDTYSYDDYGRTTAVTSNGVTATFGYDAANVRVSVNGEAQLWDRNGGLPTLISTATGDNYVHTAGIARDGDDWLLQDAVGSVRATVDQTGATVGTQDFSVFGEQLSGTGSFGFAGEQQDPTVQLHLRARQYNPGLGRFTSVDPVQPGAPATTGYNLYAYSGNNPTTWTDPSGESVPYAGTLQPSLQATPALAGAGVSIALVYYLALLRQQNIDIDLGEIADLLGDVGEALTPEIPPVGGPADALKEIARRVLPIAGSGCVGPAAAEALLLPGRAWSARPTGFEGAERTNVAAAVWCVLPLEWNRDLALSSGAPGINEGHSETQIIRDFRFDGGELRSPWTTFGLFAIHSNMSPCSDCQFNVDNLRREFIGLTVICSYSYSFEHEKQQYRDSLGEPLRRIPRPC